MNHPSPSLFSKVAGLFGHKEWVNSVLLLSDFTSYKFTDFISYLKALGKVSALAKSVDTIDKYCQMADWKLYKKDKPLDAPPADLAKILKQPNPWMDFTELKSFAVYDLLLMGNSFFSKVGATSTGMKPRELYRLYPFYVKIQKDRIEKIAWYNYGMGLSGKRYEVGEIEHLKYLVNPFDEYWGHGIVAANKNLFEHAIDLGAIRAKFLDNGAIPSGLIKLKETLNKTERDKLQVDFESKYTGRDNAGKTMVLGAGADYQRIALTPDEMKSLDDQILTSREVFMLFGIPPFLRNLSADDNPKYDNIFQQEITFRQLIIAPMLQKLDKLFNNFVQAWYPDLEFRHDDVTDRLSPENIERMVKLGIISPDEARAFFGQKPTNRPAMKKHYVPINWMPIDDLADLSDPALTAAGGKPSNVKPADEAAAAADQTGASATGEDLAKEGSRALCAIPNGRPRAKSWRGEAAGGWISTPVRGVWTAKELSGNTTIARIQRDFLRLTRASMRRRMSAAVGTYQRFLADQTARVVEKYQAHKAATVTGIKASGIDDILKAIFNEELENALVVNVGSAFYQSMSDSAYDNLADILTVNIAASENRALADRVNLLRKTAPRINDTTRDKLKVILDENISAGRTPGEIGQAIQEGLGMFNSSRPLTIARNELANAYREGNRQAMHDSQIIATVSVIGCEAEEANSPTYNGQSTCNISNVPIEDVDSLEFHVNHTGAEVPESFEMPTEE